MRARGSRWGDEDASRARARLASVTDARVMKPPLHHEAPANAASTTGSTSVICIL